MIKSPCPSLTTSIIVISASNPPPICIGVPHVKLLEVCVRLYNISYDKEHFGGCIALEFELIGIKEDFPLGCFHKSHAKLKQDYNKVRKNVEQVKKNLNIIKEKTKEEIQKWDDLFSDTYYADLKKQVVQEIGSFRNYLSDALVHFGEFMKPAQENEDKSEKPATGWQDCLHGLINSYQIGCTVHFVMNIVIIDQIG